MQIRLTVVDPLGPPSPARGRATTRDVPVTRDGRVSPDVPAEHDIPVQDVVIRDVLVTAPTGTALAAVVSDLVQAVRGSDGPVALYAGEERLDPTRRVLGEPPLIDGAVLSLGTPGELPSHPAAEGAAAQLHVVAGPDAGGVHLLHGGQVAIGRSADADVPLDDPDVSRLHCAVTLAGGASGPDGADDPSAAGGTSGTSGQVTVVDLGSTNGTTLDGVPVDDRPVPLTPGALLRVGESALRLVPAGGPVTRVRTAADGEGCVRVSVGRPGNVPADTAGVPRPRTAGAQGTHGPGSPGDGQPTPSGEARHSYGTGGWGASSGAPDRSTTGTHASGAPRIPGQAAAPRVESDTSGTGAVRSGTSDGSGVPPAEAPRGFAPHTTGAGAAGATGTPNPAATGRTAHTTGTAGAAGATDPTGATDTTAAADPVGDSSRRKATPPHGTDVPPGLRRRGGIAAWARRLAGGRAAGAADTDGLDLAAAERLAGGSGERQAPETWPDPATLLMTALGPGPRLWERGPGHPEALTVRLGTADRTAPDGSGLLRAVPVTASLRECGALGLAGPRPRLTGLARAVLAQLAALHSPDSLDIVLISNDHGRPVAERTEDWAWLGWLPHVRPARGQDCRLLLAYDHEQAVARADELLYRLEQRLTETTPAPADAATANTRTTVLVVDGDPGDAVLRAAVLRLTREGPAAGIHTLCLAETEPASPVSPVTDTYEAACAVSVPFRACGAVALLCGDVATALRLMRVATPDGTADGTPTPVGNGTVGAVDAVSLAWAERFARALAPLRPEGSEPGLDPHMSAPLPRSARLLDELGLARATPTSLMARWADAADAADETNAPGGRAWAVLGAGPRGPLHVDLAIEGPHLLVEGPHGSGRTELLRTVVASLAAAERPDRLGIVLVDGAGGDGLRACTEIPHVTAHLVANDPVRMREFAQSLTAAVKRRAESAGRPGLAVAPGSGPAGSTGPAGPARLVVVVDDLDALLFPPLGAPGRPSAGSVVRALEAVARAGERLGMHLVAASADGDVRMLEDAPRAVLDAPSPGPDGPAPGRGRLRHTDGRVTPFQGGRVTGRIPRTATQRPTVVPLDWARMGDPPARRPVRELGNGPTDLALLASALERAARSVSATEVPSLP